MQRVAYAAQYWLQLPDPIPLVPLVEEPISAGAFSLMIIAMIVASAAALCLFFKKPPPGHDMAKFGEVGDSGRIAADGPNGRIVMASLTSHLFTSRKLREDAASATAAHKGDTAVPALQGRAPRVVAGSLQQVAELQDLASVTQRVFSSSKVDDLTVISF